MACRFERDMVLPRPDRTLRRAQYRRSVLTDHIGATVVYHPARSDRHHEHGGVRWYRQDEQRQFRVLSESIGKIE